MTTLESRLRSVVAALDAAGVGCALVGGLAVSIRTEPRFTRDADLAVAVASDLEAEALIRHLRGAGHEVEALVEQDAVGRLATVRLGDAADAGASVVDLLFASSGIEHELVRDAEFLEVLPGLTMRVARTGYLIALKVLSRNDIERPQDIIDLRALFTVAQSADIDCARQALDDITSRGFQRGKDLRADLDELLGSSEP